MDIFGCFLVWKRNGPIRTWQFFIFLRYGIEWSLDVRITPILDEECSIVKRVSPERRKENAKKVGKTDGIGDLVFGRGRIIPFRAAGVSTGRDGYYRSFLCGPDGRRGCDAEQL